MSVVDVGLPPFFGEEGIPHSDALLIIYPF